MSTTVVGYYKKDGKTRPITKRKAKSSYRGQSHAPSWKDSSVKDVKGNPDEKWMKEAFAGAKGQLHQQLGIPQDETIPITFLQEIVDTPIGETAHNPTQTGKRRVKVTKLLKQRAIPVLNAAKARG